MSRIGLKTIELPEGVEVKMDGNKVTVKGPKGELSRTIHNDMVVKMEDNTVNIERPNDLKETRSLHGTTRSLIANMVEDRKSTRLNSSHVSTSYAVFCLKKKIS